MKIKQTVYIDDKIAKDLKIAAVKLGLYYGEAIEILIKNHLKELIMDQIVEFLIQILRLIVYSGGPISLKIILLVGVVVWISLIIFIFRFIWVFAAEAAKYIFALLFRH